MNKNEFCTRIPFSYYFWILLNVIILIGHFKFGFQFRDIFSIIAISTVTYICICKYACRVLIEKDIITIKYLFPLLYSIQIDISKFNQVKYELGYYYYFNTNHSLAKIQFLFPDDRILLSNSRTMKQKSVNVIVNFIDFKSLRIHLELTLNSLSE